MRIGSPANLMTMVPKKLLAQHPGWVLATLVVFVLAGGAIVWGERFWQTATRVFAHPAPFNEGSRIELAVSRPNTLVLPEDLYQEHIITTEIVSPPQPPAPLRLPANLLFDANRFVRVGCLFSGRVVRIGHFRSGPIAPEDANRQLTHGDPVFKNQLLAVVLSKEVGEKKSELVDAITKLAIDQRVLDNYMSKEVRDLVNEKTLLDAQRNVDADLIAVGKAERTLQSWGFTDDDIALVRKEANRLLQPGRQAKKQLDRDVASTWAEVPLRAPFDGILIEKNVALGDLVDPTKECFKIVDTRRFQVIAQIREEEIPLVEKLPAYKKRWKIVFPTNHENLEGNIDFIGRIIDPNNHTGSVFGWLENPKKVTLRLGQFVTAIVELPPDSSLVAVPAAALIEEGDKTSLFVQVDGNPREFTRRMVRVVHRGPDRVLVRSQPSADERLQGYEELRLGETVVTSGSLLLNADLQKLKAAAERGRK
jgi:cobalt-zinc-cadmium efflux system membrane fusion protein